MTDLRMQRIGRFPQLPWLLLGLSAVLFGFVVVERPLVPGQTPAVLLLNHVLLWDSVVARAATALVAGAALGLSGAILQRVLRNPIADPSTLGIASGAQLALAATAILVPDLALPREGVAFVGGCAAVFLVLALSWRRGLEPVTVILSGMTVALIASALSAALILANGEYLFSLFIWGAGSLHQQSWDAAQALGFQAVAGAVVAALLLRPLDLLVLDDASAKSLGLALQSTRIMLIATAVWLAGSVVAQVGIIGFVGLAAPFLARVSGARRPATVMLAAPLTGALLLWLTDLLIQAAPAVGGDLIPTGAATGLIGGPLLLWLLPRLGRHHPGDVDGGPAPRRLASPLAFFAILGAMGVGVVLIALFVGRDFQGWQIASGQLFHDLLPFRAPRLVGVAMAGLMLGAAGTVMQRMTGNAMASPEVLGVAGGAGVGLAAVLVFLPAASDLAMTAGSAAGALAVLLAVLTISGWNGFEPGRLLLAGIALGSLCLAVITAVLAGGSPRSSLLLAWMTGSADRIGPAEAVASLAAAAVLVSPLLVFSRWLDVLPLGENTARAIGLPVTPSRIALAVLAALLTGCAALVIGPLSLVGLIGPHMARLLGFSAARQQVLAASLIGCVLMMLVDWLGRVLIFPYQIPAGLLAALIGGTYLLVLLQQGQRRR